MHNPLFSACLFGVLTAVKNLSIGLEQKWRAIVRGVAVPMARSGSSDSVTNPAVSAHDTKKRPEAAPDSSMCRVYLRTCNLIYF
jgi:hypothetical protein